MGASGKWMKALIGFKKPDKDEHVSYLLLASCIYPIKKVCIFFLGQEKDCIFIVVDFVFFFFLVYI
jgi:hypothetical protein